MLKSIFVILLIVAFSALYQFFSSEPDYIQTASMAYISFFTLLMLWLSGCIKSDKKPGAPEIPKRFGVQDLVQHFGITHEQAERAINIWGGSWVIRQDKENPDFYSFQKWNNLTASDVIDAIYEISTSELESRKNYPHEPLAPCDCPLEYFGASLQQEAANVDKEDLSFGDAVETMRCGCKVAREGWNGKGMFLFLISGNAWEFTTDVSGVDEIDTLPFICMKTADNKLVPWLASQTDVIASDWRVVD